MSDRNWNEVKGEGGGDFPPVHDFEEEDTIEGKYIGKRTGVGQYKKNVYQIETANGPEDVWGSTVLDGKMDSVSQGDYVKIQYLGKPSGKKYHDYAVFTAATQ